MKKRNRHQMKATTIQVISTLSIGSFHHSLFPGG
jgi:hypothetical protein